jgi:Ca-activated chloride channel family protein
MDVVAEGVVIVPAHWFANPWALLLLSVLPPLGLLGLLALRRRRRALSRLGNLIALQVLTARHGNRGVLRGLCVFAGLFVLIVGVAGPQWGRDYEQTVVSGRDLIVLLDLSRSMLAEDALPSRQERAKKALRELTYAFQRRGGHRLALVVFAARARIICPLTHDYDHFRLALAQQDAAAPSPDLRPRPAGPTSGTRIGAGLKMAVQAHRSGSSGPPGPGMILLLSDGDDPARDEEWRAGALLAQKNRLPVFSIGVGDPRPKEPVKIPLGDDFVRHNDVPVKTRLEEKPLKEIARLTDGTYVRAGTNVLDLATVFRDWIEPQALRSRSGEVIPSYVQRYPWFFGAALFLFGVAMLIGDRRREGRRQKTEGSDEGEKDQKAEGSLDETLLTAEPAAAWEEMAVS